MQIVALCSATRKKNTSDDTIHAYVFLSRGHDYRDGFREKKDGSLSQREYLWEELGIFFGVKFFCCLFWRDGGSVKGFSV